MTDDIVDRLRNAHRHLDWRYIDLDDCGAAADEIERLRAEVVEKAHLIDQLRRDAADWEYATSAEVDLANSERDRADRLQAKIDDFARAWAAHVATGSLEHTGPFRALVAAATPKEDDDE